MGKTIQEWKTEVEKTTGRALSKNENEYFEVLTELLDMLDWKDALHAKDIALLDSKLLFVEKDPKAPLTNELWVEQPEDEYSLWQYIALLLDDRNLDIPKFLEEHTHIAEARSEILSRQRLKEARLWRNRLGNLSQRREFSHTGSLDVRLKLQGRSLKW
ncbi:MAG: hypothetical protein ACKVGW_07785, partial [Verrucomicrobiia bacterium]